MNFILDCGLRSSLRRSLLAVSICSIVVFIVILFVQSKKLVKLRWCVCSLFVWSDSRGRNTGIIKQQPIFVGFRRFFQNFVMWGVKQKFVVIWISYQVLIFVSLGYFIMQFFFVIIFRVRIGMSIYVAVTQEPELKSKVPKGFNKFGSDKSRFFTFWEVTVRKAIIMSRKPGLSQSTTE